jgi:tetratricopeptide (TPR) repeat protein
LIQFDELFDFKIVSNNFEELDGYLSNLPQVNLQQKISHIKIKCYLKQIEIAQDMTTDLLNSTDRISQPFEYLYILHCQGWVHYYSGKYRLAYNLLKESLQSLYMITLSQPTAQIIVAIDYMIIFGVLSRIMGREEETAKSFEHGLHLAGGISNLSRIQDLIGNMGELQFKRGDLVQAIDRFNTAYELAKNHGFLRYQYMWLNGLSKVYTNQGRLDKAQEVQQEAFDIASSLSDLAGIIVCAVGLGLIYYRRGQAQQALRYYEMFSSDQIKNNDTYAMILYYRFLLHYHLDDHESQLKILSEIESIDSCTDEVRIALSNKLIHAIYLKDRIKYSDKAKAEESLRSIIDGRHNPVDFRLILDAFLFLADLLLGQMNLTHKSSKSIQNEARALRSEIIELANEFESLANKHGSYSAAIEVNYLLGNLSVADMDLEVANQYFKKALQISEQYGIYHTHIRPPAESSDKTINFPSKILNQNFHESINSTIHSLPRLNIVTYLYRNGVSSFKEIQQDLGFSSGNLTRHCDKLIEAGYVYKNKAFFDAKQTTMFQLTPYGYSEFQNYVNVIKQSL